MTPAETAILDEIEARLKLISVANEYSRNIQKVERARLTPFKAGDIPAISFWPVRHSRSTNEYGNDTHVLRVVVDVRDKTRDNNFADEAAGMIADVITAINRATAAPKVSDSASFELGETVEDLTMEDSAYQIGEGQTPWLGAIVEIEITYQSPVGDMYNYTP